MYFVLRAALPSVLLGVLLAFTLTPLPLGIFSFLIMAVIFFHISRSETAKQAAMRMWWVIFAMTLIHLSWLMAFLIQLLGSPPIALMALILYAVQAGFYAIIAFLAFKLIPTPAGRAWGMAGGWVILEWIRNFGLLPFPWPTMGTALLDTPFIQIADLGGVLLVSTLIMATAAALCNWWQERRVSAIIMSVVLIGALTYGITRVPGQGPVHPILVLRTSFDSFAKASGALTYQEQVEMQTKASQVKKPSELVVWSETALFSSTPLREPYLREFPGPGISGFGVVLPKQNTAVAINADGNITSTNHKGQLVPFGEYFPFYDSFLKPVYSLVEQSLGFRLNSGKNATNLVPLELNGIKYGAYICYDSVFSRVPRELTRKGAQVLVNPSNDGWYTGWGVKQHFEMGRVRAIENRRWVVRSVNNGIAGSVNDLGQPIDILEKARGPSPRVDTLSVRPKLLKGETFYTRNGDWPTLLLAFLLIVFGLLQRGKVNKAEE